MLTRGSRTCHQLGACVFFHAHPDDEALLTGGTMALLAAEGHRVVLVLATAGERGLSADANGGSGLAALRRREAAAAAGALGCARLVVLGYGDSGWPPGPTGAAAGAFAGADVERAARRLAAVLRQERARLLTTYDPAGGYGHPDHVQVHRVGARAAELARTPVVLQATFDRARLVRILRLLAPLRRFAPAADPAVFRHAYTPPHLITHRVAVHAHLDAKRRGLAAHASQTTGGDAVRTLAFLLRLPRPLFRRALGVEYFVQPGVDPGRGLRHPLEAAPGGRPRGGGRGTQ
ncbi:PIG-L family deacetylase [Kitasatospora phosalacinea]|uniref:PIG-L family deacetylase n=1 Tax=Kitasatospora phosalacinea TaxID=2065 RepID=UPI0036679258